MATILFYSVVSFMLPYSRDHENNLAKGWDTNVLWLSKIVGLTFSAMAKDPCLSGAVEFVHVARRCR